MIKAGITGGIGSGKSLVCSIFSKLGVPIYSADIRARVLMNENKDIKTKLIEYFGVKVYINSQIDRVYLANIIFNNTKAVDFVNNLVHPVVRYDFDQWCLQFKQNHYIIQEAALLFETGGYKTMDVIITVTAPEIMRVPRVQNRDGLTSEQVYSRIKNQMNDNDKINRSDFVIYNDERHSVLEQVLSIDRQLQLKN